MASQNPTTNTGQINFEPVGGQDSLTQFVRSMQNLVGQQGKSNLQTGGQQFQGGVTAAAPAVDFLTKLVRGDQADLAQATQPETDQITQQFSQIRNMITAQPRGGGKASVLAELPFEKEKQVQGARQGMRKGAAGELGGLASTLAGLGLGEQQ